MDATLVRKARNAAVNAGLRNFLAMLDAAEARGWPEAFERDLLFHDLGACRRLDQCEPFCWVLRQTGTHIIYPETQASRWPSGIARAFSEDCCEFFWWDGRELTHLRDADHASERLLAALCACGKTFGSDHRPVAAYGGWVCPDAIGQAAQE